MKRVLVKICGLTTREAVETAVEAGADAVGFVFAPSPRRVSAGWAAAVCADLPREVVRVAVFGRPAAGAVRRVLERFAADLIQSDFDSPSPGPDNGDGRPAWLPVYRDTRAGLAALAVRLGSARSRPRILFEGARSGSGRPVDCGRAARFARDARMVLAGGLTPGNVVAALGRVQPYGVDVSSGVETRPGVKDPVRIRDFLDAVRASEQAGYAVEERP